MNLIHLLCIVAPYGLYFLPVSWVLEGAGALAIAAALPVIFRKEEPAGAQEFLISTVAFFAALAINRQHPMVAYSALALWGGRRFLSFGGMPREMPPPRLVAAWLSAFAPLALSSFYGEMGLPTAALGAAVLVAVSRMVTGRIARGLRGMTGEAAGAALMAVFIIFRSENLVFLNSPFWGIAGGILCGILFFKLKFLDRLTAWLVTFSGAVIYVAAGLELFEFYLLFFAVFEMGKRLPYQNSKDVTSAYWAQRAFAATSVGAAATAILSVGASDPFPFFFAIAGAFSAAVFSAWAGWGEYAAKRLLFGFWGSALLAVCGWLSSTYPAGAAPLVMFTGFAAAGAYYARGVLASPEKDQRWLEYMFGALTAVFLFKAFTAYLA